MSGLHEEVELSIVMPCRNEEHTVGICIDEARAFLRDRGIRGEILVVDNHSSDRSAETALEHGAGVERVDDIGYGHALRYGLLKAKGAVIIMGDCDTTYDFTEAGGIYDMLVSGSFDVVIGDRFAGGIEKGAMPLLHKIGVRVLSWLGRRRFRTDVKDFHCGLRGLTREAYEKLSLHTSGMEFATELIAEAAKSGLKTGQIPVKLRRCRQERRSKLRTIRDGMRHLLYIGSAGSG